MNSADQHKANLMRELTQVLKDAEELIKNSEQQAGDGFQSAKDKLEATLKNAKQEIHRITLGKRRGSLLVLAYW